MKAAGRALVRTSVAAAAVIAWIGWVAVSETWTLGRHVVWLRGTGWLACGSLSLSLLMSPLGRAVRGLFGGRSMAAWIAYRRAFGVVAAVAGGLHAAVALSTYLWTSWRAVLETPYLRSGLIALLVLLALLVTSFPRLVASFGITGWKELHRLAYVAAALVLHHLLLSPFAPRGWTLLVFGVVLAAAPLRFIRARRAPRD